VGSSKASKRRNMNLAVDPVSAVVNRIVWWGQIRGQAQCPWTQYGPSQCGGTQTRRGVG
jgi:hypothetical protein